jgi:hypothetical protein
MATATNEDTVFEAVVRAVAIGGLLGLICAALFFAAILILA